MKIAKKIIAAALAFGFGFSAFAELPVDILFENELIFDTVQFDSKNNTLMGDLTERPHFEISHEKFDAMIEVELKFGQDKRIFGTAKSLGDAIESDMADSPEHFRFGYSDLDYYINVRPFSIMEVSFHNGLAVRGASLAIWDDDIGSGKIGSDGFTLSFLPADGFRLTGKIFLPAGHDDGTWGAKNYLNGKKVMEGDNVVWNENNTFNFGFGACYEDERFSLGVNFDNVADDDGRVIGIYGEVLPLENLTIGGGFGMAKEGNKILLDELDPFKTVYLYGKNIYNAQVGYENDSVSFAAEVAGNTDKEDSAYDLYAGLLLEVSLNDRLGVGLEGQLFNDFGNINDVPALDTGFALTPYVTIAGNKNHSFAAGVSYMNNDGTSLVKIPLLWKYSISK